MHEAIALSTHNKAKTTNEKGSLVVIQQRYNHNFWWFHIWILGSIIGDTEFDAKASELNEKAKHWEFQPESKHWQSV